MLMKDFSGEAASARRELALGPVSDGETALQGI